MAASATKTKTTPENAVEEYDFDSWTEEDENAALRALNEVKYIIVEGVFVGRFSDNTIVKIPLKLTLDMVDELQDKYENPIDQFRHLIKTFAGEDVAVQLGGSDLIGVSIMTEKYFSCFTRAQQLSFPESKPSSN